jgi:hypothetical protein
VAVADLADDDAARRAAWQQYADAVAQRLANVEPLYENGIRGGEAERYYLLLCCALKAEAELAKLNGDRAAELSAVTRGAATAQRLLDAARAAYEAETITVEDFVDAIHRRAAAEQQLARLRPDVLRKHDPQRKQAAELFQLTTKLNAMRLVAVGGNNSGTLHYVTCQYILVRCRMAEKRDR